MSKNEPDWAALRHIAKKMAVLEKMGEWSEAQFRRLFQEAKVAAGPFPQALEFLLNHADPAWLNKPVGTMIPDPEAEIIQWIADIQRRASTLTPAEWTDLLFSDFNRKGSELTVVWNNPGLTPTDLGMVSMWQVIRSAPHAPPSTDVDLWVVWRSFGFTESAWANHISHATHWNITGRGLELYMEDRVMLVRPCLDEEAWARCKAMERAIPGIDEMLARAALVEAEEAYGVYSLQC